MEKQAKDNQTWWLPCCKMLPPWQQRADLWQHACSLPLPMPNWLTSVASKTEFYPKFVSHCNSLGSWARLFSATLLSTTCMAMIFSSGPDWDFPLLIQWRNTLRFPRDCFAEKQPTCKRMDSQDLSAISNPGLKLSKSLHFREKVTSTNLWNYWQSRGINVEKPDTEIC